MQPTVWLLSAYRSDSHAYWVDRLLRDHPDFDWRVFELPGRHFSWRIRSNPLSWLDQISEAISSTPPDLIVASSMVDLATIKGLHPGLARVPSLYYFHENQLAYPIIPGQVQSIEPAMVQIYGALAADLVLFNSRYNLSSFLDGLTTMNKRLPDGLPGNLAERIEAKAQVLPVAVDSVPGSPDRSGQLILWNHRWEHDKQPERFAEALYALDRADSQFELALLGPRGKRPHPALQALLDHFGRRVRVNGFVSRDEYEHWLGRSSLVASTAIHEFQGISLLEAVSAGARPVVPDALCYREQYPEACRYRPNSIPELIKALQHALAFRHEPAPDIDRWLAPHVQPQWNELLSRFSF